MLSLIEKAAEDFRQEARCRDERCVSAHIQFNTNTTKHQRKSFVLNGRSRIEGADFPDLAAERRGVDGGVS